MMRSDLNRRDLTIQAISLLNLKTKIHIGSSTREIAVCCPIHGVDKTPSFFIDLDKGLCHCFSCNWSGNIEKLYRTLTGQSLYRALGYNNDSFSSFARAPLKFNFYTNLERVETALKSVYVNYDSKALVDIEGTPAESYIHSRGISLDRAHSMKMKYCEETRINGTLFKRRLIIPVYEDNKLLSFEGRRVYPEDPDPKVLYPKNCTVNTLYDIDNLDKAQPIYACEGLMDLAVLRECEYFKNSTSIFGANLTKRQIELFKQFPKVIYINDLDEAGERTLGALKASDIPNVYKLVLPKEVNGIKIKDIGDLPKAHICVGDLLKHNWLNYEFPLRTN